MLERHFLVFHDAINLPCQYRSLFLGVIANLLETATNEIEIKEELKQETNGLDFNDPLTTTFIKQDLDDYDQEGTYIFFEISNIFWLKI